MAWLLLLAAGLMECAWAIGLKYTEGFSRLWPSVITMVCMALSILGLAQAMKQIPVGTAYAVWTGIGAVGVAIAGMILFGESREWPRLLAMFFIIAGIVGLKIFTKA